MAPIPVSVLTGFLGSGKTTLLNRILAHDDMAGTAVIINEFGDVALDHLLVERASEDVVMLSNGCLCCSVGGELVDRLLDLIARNGRGEIGALSRIVIETTGLADPAPVLHSIMAHPALAGALRLDGVIATVDAVNGAATLDRHEEAVRQVAFADRIVVTKTDLAGEGRVPDALARRLAALNPAAAILDACDPGFGPARLFDCGLYDPRTKSADVARWLNEEAVAAAAHHHHHHHHGDEPDANRHDARVRAFTLCHDAPVPISAVEAFFDMLRTLHGAQLLRMKGIVRLEEDPDRPLVVHAVQTVFHPPARLPEWPDGDRRTRLVLITMDVAEDRIRALFDAFVGRPSVDRPDRAAIEENPLAIPGLAR